MPGTGIFLFDRDLRYLRARGDALRDVGLTPEGVEGKTIWEALPPETCRVIEGPYRAVFSGETSLRDMPFAGRTYATNVCPVRDHDGAILCGLVVAQEVTSPAELDEELSGNRARYRHLLESITGYTHTTTYFDDRAAVTTHSPGVLPVTGYTTEDYSANPYLWLEMVEPADRPAVEEHVAKALRDELVPPLEHRIRHRNGEVRWVRSTLVSRRDPETGLRIADGLIEDVTERRRAQEATAEAKGFLQQVVDASPSLVFVVSATGQLRFVNRYAADYYGTTPEALIARSTQTVHQSAPEAESFVADDAEVIRTRSTLVKEEQNTAPDGSVHWFHTIKVPFFHGDGAVDVLGISTDITERKRAEVALQQSEARFRMLTEASFEGIAITEGGVVVDVNDQLVAVLGYERAELVGHAVVDLVAPESREHVARQMRSGDVTYEHWMVRKDGNRVLMEARGRSLEVGGRRLRVTALRDITERRRAEAERREFERVIHDTQRLEALGTLAGGVAHDFNNILAAIFGHLALARRDLETNHPVQASLRDVSDLSTRARDLVRQILSFSSSPSEHHRPLDLGRELAEAARMLRATIPSTIEIRTEIERELPRVNADATQIHRIIVNLCTNAWHAIGAGPGRMTLALGVEDVDATRTADDPRMRPGRFVVLSVRDTGSGIDAALLSRIFEPFFTTKGSRQGTGLGLAVVHGIVRAHGGFVLVRSAPGEGADFRVYLPAAREPVSEAPPTPRATSEGARGGRVLLLDDEPQVGRVCSLLLERAGYEVATFQSPHEALAHFRRNPAVYDLVITDMTMPEMDGLAFSRAVRALRADVPIVLATGYSTLVTKEAASELGIQALLQKPVAPNDFVDVVRRVLEGAPRSSR